MNPVVVEEPVSRSPAGFVVGFIIMALVMPLYLPIAYASDSCFAMYITRQSRRSASQKRGRSASTGYGSSTFLDRHFGSDTRFDAMFRQPLYRDVGTFLGFSKGG